MAWFIAIGILRTFSNAPSTFPRQVSSDSEGLVPYCGCQHIVLLCFKQHFIDCIKGKHLIHLGSIFRICRVTVHPPPRVLLLTYQTFSLYASLFTAFVLSDRTQLISPSRYKACCVISVIHSSVFLVFTRLPF